MPLFAASNLNDLSRWARGNGLEILLLAIGSVLAGRFVHWLSERYQERLYQNVLAQIEHGGVPSEQTKQARAFAQAGEIAVVALIYFVAALLILSKFGLPLASIIPGATVVGVGLGFGAQQVVADLLAGFFLLSERQLGVGDVVQLAQPGQTTGVRGTVEELTLRVTKLRTVQGELVFLPNSALRQVTNLSREWSRIVVDVPIPVTQDLDRAADVLREATATIWEDSTWHDALLGEPTIAGVENIEADHLLLRVIARTLPGKQFDVGHALRFRIAVALQQAGIAAPVASPATTGS